MKVERDPISVVSLLINPPAITQLSCFAVSSDIWSWQEQKHTQHECVDAFYVHKAFFACMHVHSAACVCSAAVVCF